MERLLCEGHRVTCFFYNPNIHPSDEYAKRLSFSKKACEELSVPLVEGKYDRENWFGSAKGSEYSPEGGERCRICWDIRIRETYLHMKENGFDAFATTLTVSPSKNASVICEIGRSLAGDRFLCYDFKKKGGFQRSSELAREWGLYRQDYCGCIYSREEKIRRDIGRRTG